jgi:transcriptional regulator with XRE-family HTH domain
MKKNDDLNREDGRIRLQALIDLFGVTLADIARAAGVSRPLVSRILHGDPKVNPQFLYSRLERNLEALIRSRRRMFFPVEAVDLESIQDVATKLRKSIATIGSKVLTDNASTGAS